ncbi:MAG: T9SS type A sorting domain-containing protein [Croceimicrobium sp.]
MLKIYKIMGALLAPLFINAQNGPIDFEANGEGAAWTWTVFENDSNPALEIVANPDPSGLNTSATVAKFTALQAGNPWAGCETLHGAGTGSFLIDANNAQIRIMVWKTEISDVGIKLVRPDGWSLGEIKVPNTKTNEWEQITFDFSSHIGLTPAYDQLVVFPDFQARTSDQVIYFDNIFGPAASLSEKEISLPQIELYPNPGTRNFQVKSAELIQVIQVFSLNGALLAEYQAAATELEIPMEKLVPGVYLIRVIGDQFQQNFRWIKEG